MINKLPQSFNEFAGPLAQGVIDQFCSSSLFVTPLYPPGDPRPPLPAGLGFLGPPPDPAKGPRRHGFCIRTLLISTFFNLVQIMKNNEKRRKVTQQAGQKMHPDSSRSQGAVSLPIHSLTWGRCFPSAVKVRPIAGLKVCLKSMSSSQVVQSLLVKACA